MVLGNLLITLGRLLNFVLGLYIWLIIIRALVSWFNPNPYSQWIRLLIILTEPALRPIRRVLPANLGIDISPLIAIIILYFVKSFIASTILDLGVKIH